MTEFSEVSARKTLTLPGKLVGGLRIAGVSVAYQGVPAVRGVSLDVAPGEIVALLGPSGSGKSSLLRAVVGLEPLAGGAVSWGGADLAGVPVHRRGFGLMFQDGQLFPHRDVAGNVEFGLQMAGVRRAERARRVEELLELVGLTGFGSRAIETLSGGEQQRVTLARALAPEPALLLLDEPLSALDRSLRERLASDLRAALLATGTTSLFVTHDHDEAFAVADRVAVLDGGRLLQVATPAELWRAPATREVAEFLGYEAVLDLSSLREPLASALGAAAAPAGAALGGAAWVALAEGAFVVTDRESGGREAASTDVTGQVRSVAFRRGRTELVVDVDGAGLVTAVVRGVGDWRPRDVVGHELDADRVVRLPAIASADPDVSWGRTD